MATPHEFEPMQRAEVFRGMQSLMLKRGDITIDRLARVFKLKPESIYLEEEVTKHVEFPTDGKFDISTYGRFEVNGDPAKEVDVETPRPFTSSNVWSIPRPWSAGPSSSGGPPAGIRSKRLSASQPYDLFLKRTIPFVSLCLDQSGRNIIVDHTINNIYIKIPENSVSVQSILSAMATKISCEANEIVILDVKFLEISDDKDLEYWKVPSRRFYVAKKDEYEVVVKTRKRLSLSLNRKRKKSVLYTESDEEETTSMTTQNMIKKIDDDFSKFIGDFGEMKKFKEEKSEVVKALECKICKDIPRGPKVVLLCCSQIIGCQDCFTEWNAHHSSCPLCRSDNPDSSVINGLDAVYSFFNQ